MPAGHAFKDALGREWWLHLTHASNAIARTQADVSLYALCEQGFKPLGQLFADPEKFVGLLWALCQEQAAAKGLTAEDFGKGFDGDTIAASGDAFYAEYLVFCHPRQRAALKKIREKGETLAETLTKRAWAELDALDADQVADRMLRGTILSSSPSNAPASSASTPTPGPSGIS